MYSFKSDKKIKGEYEKKRAKGVQKSYVKKTLLHEHYIQCLFENIQHNAVFHSIRQTGHVLKTLKIEKKALVNSDNKKYMVNDGINSLPYGHYSLGSKLSACCWVSVLEHNTGPTEKKKPNL